MRGLRKNRSIAIGTALLTAAAIGTAAAPSSSAGTSEPSAGHDRTNGARMSADRIAVDTRVAAGGALAASRVALASASPATRAYVASLGTQGVFQLDPTTKTVRIAESLNGYLTTPSSASPASVALGYVRAHLAPLGLDASDLPTFQLTRDYADVAGTHHLSWTQSVGGVPVFGAGLQAAVSRTGRLVLVGGAPVSHLRLPLAAASASSSLNTASAAVASARTSMHEPAAAGPNDVAERVLFMTASGVRSGWQVITMSAAQPATTVVDNNGHVLYRRSLSSDANPSGDTTPATPPPPATGIAYQYFPGHARVAGSRSRSTSPSSAGCPRRR